MDLDALSFVLGALAVLVCVVAWCWVRRPPKWECDVAGLARRVIAELNAMPTDDPSDGAAIRRALAVLEDALEQHTVTDDLWLDEKATDPFRRGFQPTTQSAIPRLPDGSEAVSGVVDPRMRGFATGGVVRGSVSPMLSGDHPKPQRCELTDAHEHVAPSRRAVIPGEPPYEALHRHYGGAPCSFVLRKDPPPPPASPTRAGA